MNKLVVIKFGGSALEVPQAAARFAQAVVEIQSKGFAPIVVHGGGKSLSRWMERVNLTPRFVEGLRYTDEPTLELAQMVLSGKANKDLVSLLNAAGGVAVGLSGTDGRLFHPKRVSSPGGADIGFVAEIEHIDSALLDALIEKKYIPVVCSVGHDRSGQAFNINADHVASELARALKVQDLILLTDVDGIMLDGVLQQRIPAAQGEQLLRHPSIGGGMRPKIEYALRALSGGVERAHIVNAGRDNVIAEILGGHAETGTTLHSN